MEKLGNLLCDFFFIGKQKIVLFLKYRKNGWETDGSALSSLYPKSYLNIFNYIIPKSHSLFIRLCYNHVSRIAIYIHLLKLETYT
jgi:hypothetical protein